MKGHGVISGVYKVLDVRSDDGRQYIKLEGGGGFDVNSRDIPSKLLGLLVGSNIKMDIRRWPPVEREDLRVYYDGCLIFPLLKEPVP